VPKFQQLLAQLKSSRPPPLLQQLEKSQQVRRPQLEKSQQVRQQLETFEQATRPVLLEKFQPVGQPQLETLEQARPMQAKEL
jgi:hypothetical protein